MRQRRSTPDTQYEVIRGNKPTLADGYPQQIEIWDALRDLERENRNQLHTELRIRKHRRPMGAKMDTDYVRIELTNLCKRGFIRRVSG